MGIDTYSMLLNKRRAWGISIGLHLSVFVIALLSMAVQWFLHRQKEPPHVFELVSAPAFSTPTPTQTPQQTQQEQPTPTPEEPLLQQQMPDLKPVEPIQLPPEEVPAPVVTQTKPKTVQEKPKVQPKPEPPKPKVISFNDFAQKNPIKTPTQTQTKPKTRQVDIPKIDSQDIVRSLQSSLADTASIQQMNSMSSDQQAELQRYYAIIKQAIDVHFKAPNGLSSRLITKVRFHVDGNGRLSGASIVSSSGNSIFDQAAMDTFKRISRVSPPPGNRSFSFVINFTME